MADKVDQSKAIAHRGDVVGGSKVENITNLNFYTPPSTGVVGSLLDTLEMEMSKNIEIQQTIGRLQDFYDRQVPSDGVIGLEAKLRASNRTDDLHRALAKKELFVKTLEKWSLYASAQEIFVHLLARAEHEFQSLISPQINQLSEVEVNSITTTRIIDPMVLDCANSPLQIDHTVAMGMVYWLAEQGFVRWHR